MAESAVPPGAPRPRWHQGTVVEVSHPNREAVLLRISVPEKLTYLPGQHVVVRLTADDGYQASRSYSLASAPHQELLELYVERFADGEVSPYLADDIETGDPVELRGPIGGWFVWDGSAPATAVGGGTGIVPVVSMLRHAEARGITDRLRVLAVARMLNELPYAEELAAYGAQVALSRETGPTGRPARRLGPSDVTPLLTSDRTYFVCGSAGFAESTSQLLVSSGVAPGRIRVERFGPTA
jgi:ferredoxin-NADP reductase